MTTTSEQSAVDIAHRVIGSNQSVSGAYVASPNFAEYNFGWLRDGAYCALAMDAAGLRASSAAFHDWAASAVVSQRERIASIIAVLETGAVPSAQEMLPTRYTLAGVPEVIDGEAWPNFQLDGYGTWLFALHSHTGGALPQGFRSAVELAARYLEATWQLPCFDYWEESGDRQHTSTLASIAAGLRSASRLLDDPALDAVADIVLTHIFDNCVVDGSFVKGPTDDRVDASLISLATPFALVDPLHPVMVKTIGRIRTELSSPTGGIYRYLGDTYFGGNPWLLLTAWLGWHDRITGNTEGHKRARAWVLAAATAHGALPEQILHEPQDETFVQEWIDRWGPVANPLLWSHAKLILMESGEGATAWN